MSGDEQFWSHVQIALDERRDPLEDDAVLEGIVAEPERLQKLLELLERLEQLSRVTRRWPLRRIAVAAAALMAVGSGIFWFTQREVGVPRPLPSLQGRVISVEWEFSTQTPTSSRTTVITDRGLTARAEYHSDPQHDTTWTTESTRARYP